MLFNKESNGVLILLFFIPEVIELKLFERLKHGVSLCLQKPIAGVKLVSRKERETFILASPYLG